MSARGGTGVWLGAALLLLAGTALAQALDVALDAYRTAPGGLGAVAGRAYAERRTADGPDEPLVGTTILLLPRSEAFLGRLRDLKAAARDSLGAFRTAVPAVIALRDTYVAALRDAGAGELVRAATVEAGGTFVVENVPAGDWVLVATHARFVEGRSKPPGHRERTIFVPAPRLAGYEAVSVWLQEVSVRPGGTQPVALTDRNDWLRGVVEQTAGGAGR